MITSMTGCAVQHLPRLRNAFLSKLSYWGDIFLEKCLICLRKNYALVAVLPYLAEGFASSAEEQTAKCSSALTYGCVWVCAVPVCSGPERAGNVLGVVAPSTFLRFCPSKTDYIIALRYSLHLLQSLSVYIRLSFTLQLKLYEYHTASLRFDSIDLS